MDGNLLKHLIDMACQQTFLFTFDSSTYASWHARKILQGEMDMRHASMMAKVVTRKS